MERVGEVHALFGPVERLGVRMPMSSKATVGRPANFRKYQDRSSIEAIDRRNTHSASSATVDGTKTCSASMKAVRAGIVRVAGRP